MSNDLEIPVGGIVRIGGKAYKCVEDKGNGMDCGGCALYDEERGDCTHPFICSAEYRSDDKDVMYISLI